MRFLPKAPSAPWLSAELAYRSCLSVHALTLELHCADCGARACSLCVVVVGEDWLCAACVRARGRREG